VTLSYSLIAFQLKSSTSRRLGAGRLSLPSVPRYEMGRFNLNRRHGMTKQTMREEAERLIRETLARKTIAVKQGDTRIEAKCGKCGAANRVSVAKGTLRAAFACKECGHQQETL
jgi:transcription elongation factor Elf1